MNELDLAVIELKKLMNAINFEAREKRGEKERNEKRKKEKFNKATF